MKNQKDSIPAAKLTALVILFAIFCFYQYT